MVHRAGREGLRLRQSGDVPAGLRRHLLDHADVVPASIHGRERVTRSVWMYYLYASDVSGVGF